MGNEEREATICRRPPAGPMLARLARATLTPEQMKAFTQAIQDAKAAGLDQMEAAKEKYLELTGRTVGQAWQDGGREAVNKVTWKDESPLPEIEPMGVDGWDV